jgi:glycosyltransferase involved in cell wall biosynthesis
MIHLFLNGLAASAGAGLTYIRNVTPHLSASPGVQATIALSPSLRRELGNPPNISFLEVESIGAPRRFWFEQQRLPQLIRRSGANVLVSTGNFALRRSPVPQILLSGNSLYTSRDFFSDLFTRHEYRMWLDTRLRGLLARSSVNWANCTVAPSEAFAAELRRWTGNRHVVGIHHGFDHAAFFRDQTALPPGIADRLLPANGTLRLLFVSHYNYYRNFETLFRALPLLKQNLKQWKIRLLLTCQLTPGANPGSYSPAAAASLVRELGVAEEVVELGTVPYHLLHQVYRSCDIYVTAAYAETFAHPLVEAMASALPVVASGLAVHREICGSAGLFFDRFSPQALAGQISELAVSSQLRRDLSDRGLARSRDFSWRHHVEQVVSLAQSLLKTRGLPNLEQPRQGIDANHGAHS